MKEKRDCAIQYAKSKYGGMDVVCDKYSLTKDEANKLWAELYKDAAKHIASGGEVELAYWVEMKDDTDYHKTLHHISLDAEVQRGMIWVRSYFPSEIK